MVQWDNPLCDQKDCILYKVSLYALCDLGLSWLRFEHQTFRMRGQRSNPPHHRYGRDICGIFTKTHFTLIYSIMH